MSLILVLGGVRSGKSQYAERLLEATGLPVVYVATGAGGDPEMAERIARHRRRRPPNWRTVETADPASALEAAEGAAVLLDGLSGWICALMDANGLFTDQAVAALGNMGEQARHRAHEAIRAFAATAAARAEPVVVVGDEAGLGGVPQGAGSRRFLDLAGEAAQLLAEAARAVWLVVAGQPVTLKSETPETLKVNKAPGPIRAMHVHGDSQVPPGHLDFAVNVVPGGPPAQIREGLAAALEGIDKYPNQAAAIAALAARHQRRPEEVLPLNGAAEAFYLLPSLLPRHAVCVHPSFMESEAGLLSAGIGVERVLRDPQDFGLDPGAIDTRADLVVVGNPNNPTGSLDPASSLSTLARAGRVLVVDEAFMDFCPGEPESLAARADLPGLVVLRSLTKLWALPGLRAGYLLGPADVVARLRDARQPWSVNALALAALEAYGLGVADDESTARAGQVTGWRLQLAQALRRLPGVRVWDSAANFLLLHVPDGPGVRAGLNERGIAVRRADTFPGLTPNHLRVAVRTPQDNARLVKALEEVL